MSTLLLRLSSPLQSWGAENKFERRLTHREPTKSGVVGLLAAALGIRREGGGSPYRLDDLAALRFGVRVDQPGQMLKDYHVVLDENNVPKYVTERYYLADAVFLVGLEGDGVLLRALDSAVRSPYFPLYLGRRSCPPTGKVSLGIQEKPLEDALREAEWQAGDWYQKKCQYKASLALVLDSDTPGMLRRRDLPVSLSPSHRKYAFRYIHDRAGAVDVCKQPPDQFGTGHDPWATLDSIGEEADHVLIPD
ncbi:MAG: type I-E CRISPR-associated protein Cas5/CasD [Clostridiales bacterium]|jgi:CRISPR system Cascade subunit CasD|nr:type I-E CRISPR-associated protein Cas5/CasD [Clostridiales bacterium]